MRAEALVRLQLAKRGDHPVPDGALADGAAWVMRSSYDGHPVPESEGLVAIVLRFGFMGAFNGYVAGQLTPEHVGRHLEEVVSSLPAHTRVNRYGIIAGRGNDVAIMLGSAEAKLADIPRTAAPNNRVRLSGVVDGRYERASVFVASPDGKVTETRMSGRLVDASIPLQSEGTYRLEVMGYDEAGPRVLINVPVRVGKASTDPDADDRGTRDPTLTEEQAETKILELLNEARRAAGLRELIADSELANVAVGHSRDMATHGFFGHVSPTTGTTRDRIARAELRVADVAECLASAPNPRSAFEWLMASPGHRSGLLAPLVTHAGIGVAFINDALAAHHPGERFLAVTVLLGRRVPSAATRVSTARVVEYIQNLRKQKRLPPLRIDRSLSIASRAGVREALAGRFDRIQAASDAALNNLPARSTSAQAVCTLPYEIIEPRQLGDGLQVLSAPRAFNLGVASAVREAKNGPRLEVVLEVEVTGEPGTKCPE